MTIPRRVLSLTVVLAGILAPAAIGGEAVGGQGFQRVREQAAKPWTIVDQGRPAADIILLESCRQDELVLNAAQWLVGFARRTTQAAVPIGDEGRLSAGKLHVLVGVGKHPLLDRLASAGKFELPSHVGDQGFVIQRAVDPEAGDVLICWSPAPLGCRYGLIEILRSLEVRGSTVTTRLGRVVERPQFPLRICYVNFAEHLQNAFNPNVLFDVPVNRWSAGDWERFIDMVSAFRYNIFEFWLVPTLFSPEALRGGKIQRQFAETMNRAIAYAKTRGVLVHPIQAVNTVGAKWEYLCPHVPAEHAQIVALWDHWSRALKGNRCIGLFPGDPGGCTKNGCTPETFVDLCLELAGVVRKNNPDVQIEVNTWGEPFGGWGVPLWSGKPDRTKTSMKYFLAKLPEFPTGTFTSINLGFSPDCHPNTHGGDGRPYARQASKICPVLTWDYSASEGEGTVSPRCRLRRMVERRREEMALGCYSGGICYTMAPKLQCLSIFCSAETWWNPSRTPEAVLGDFGRLVFGDELTAIGPLLEEFEVVPDWGYYPPFPYSPQRLEKAMARLLPLLEKVPGDADSRLPLATTLAEYRGSLMFYADLFRKLAEVAIAVDETSASARASGKVPPDRAGPVPIDDVDQILAEPGDFPQKDRLRALAARLRGLDVPRLTKSYWDRVYGIYSVIPHPVDPRAQGATSVLFARFNCQYAGPQPPTALDKPLRATRKPFALVRLGAVATTGWRLAGWSVHGDDGGEAWSASFDQPGLIARDDFQDKGYRWLVVRLTEGPKGATKTITVNGRVIGQFVRSGPPATEKKEWWVTRCYPIPAGLLKSGRIEIRFTDPGIAVAAVALSAERVADSDQ
jgi:hypothetical protein